MPEFSQSDSLSHIVTDSTISIKKAEPVTKKTNSLLSKADFEKSAYMLRYDSLTFRYSLDSVVAKIYAIPSVSHINGYTGNQIPPMLKNQDGVFLSLLFCFFLISKIIQRGYRSIFEGLRFLVTFREKKDFFNEMTAKEFWGDLFFILFPAFLCSLLAYNYLQTGDTVSRHPFHIWMTITGFTLTIALAMLGKYLFYRLIGYTFEIKEFTEKYMKIYYLLLEVLGVLIFVPTLICIYAGKYQDILIPALLLLFILTRLILFSRLIAFFFNKRVNFLFGIAYLCAVEITPYIFLFLGFQFLYKEDIFCIV